MSVASAENQTKLSLVGEKCSPLGGWKSRLVDRRKKMKGEKSAKHQPQEIGRECVCVGAMCGGTESLSSDGYPLNNIIDLLKSS